MMFRYGRPRSKEESHAMLSEKIEPEELEKRTHVVASLEKTVLVFHSPFSSLKAAFAYS